MAKALSRAEGTIVNGRIAAVVKGDCDTPMVDDGVLMLTYIIDTQIRLNATDFAPGSTLEDVVQDIVSRATGDFDGLISIATDSMKTDVPNGVRVSFMASAHMGCEECAEASDCPIWENANKYPLAITEKTSEENAKKEDRKLKLLLH